jgi:hypothetical protein
LQSKVTNFMKQGSTFAGIMVSGLPIGEPAFVTEVMRALVGAAGEWRRELH